MNDRALAELRRLAELDRELAERAVQQRAADAAAAEIREGAELIDTFFATYPQREAERRTTVQDAEAELVRRRTELAEAKSFAAEARTDEDRERAAKAVERGIDHVAVAEAAVRRARVALERLERDATELPDELADLERRAGVTGPRALVDWAARRRADLFVELGQIDTQRERVIREANELATMLLGEPTYGSTAAQALARVERG